MTDGYVQQAFYTSFFLLNRNYQNELFDLVIACVRLPRSYLNLQRLH